MAPTLTSNSFHLTRSPHSTLSFRTCNRLAVFAKKSGGPFQFGRPKDGSSEEESPGDARFQNPFPNFNFAKVPDARSLIPVVTNPASALQFASQRRKDPRTVFVAGASGQVGVRIARTLLRDGFSVRAGVPQLDAAQDLARLAAAYKIISNDESKRLNAVQSTFDDTESIAKAIGNASKVVVTIGPCENGPTAEVSTSDAWQVVQAAQLAGVGHVAIVYDGTIAGGGSTYNVLDGFKLFFNNLFSQPQSLSVPEFLQKVVIETDVSYTFINTSLTDDFKPESSYNVVVSAEGSLGPDDFKVAKSKIATLVADVFSNTAVAENKVVDVFTDPSAPLRSVDELFSAIPEDGRRKVYAESLEKAKAEEEARSAAEKARDAAVKAKKLEEEVKKLSDQEAQASSLAEQAQKKAEAAGVSVEDVMDKAKGITAGFSWEKLSTQISTAVQTAGVEIPKVQIATTRGQAKARSLPVQKAVVKQSAAKPNPKPGPKKVPQAGETKQTEDKKEVRKLFGGLFQQETIYVEDD